MTVHPDDRGAFPMPQFDGTGSTPPSSDPADASGALRTGINHESSIDTPVRGIPVVAQEPAAPLDAPLPAVPAAEGAHLDLATSIEHSRRRVIRPDGGWRRAVYDLTGGRVNPGPGGAQRDRDALIQRIRQPLRGGTYHVMVWSQKGGVGKTTVATALGTTVAKHRSDAVLALDTNPDGGSLAVRVPKTTERTVLDLRDRLARGHLPPADLDLFVNKNPATRLDSLVMPPGRKPERPLTAHDYVDIANALRQTYQYKVILTDCGTDLSSPVMEGVLAVTDQLVVVTTTVHDEAIVTSGGLEALIREGHADLVHNAITVLVEKAPKDPDASRQREIEATAEQIHDYFAQLTSEVITVPYDSRIRIGSEFDPEAVSDQSRAAHLQLTARIIDALGAQTGRRR